MVKYYCDLCGNEVYDREDFYSLTLFQRGKTERSYYDHQTDICPNCYNEIIDFIKKKKENQKIIGQK